MKGKDWWLEVHSMLSASRLSSYRIPETASPQRERSLQDFVRKKLVDEGAPAAAAEPRGSGAMENSVGRRQIPRAPDQHETLPSTSSAFAAVSRGEPHPPQTTTRSALHFAWFSGFSGDFFQFFQASSLSWLCFKPGLSAFSSSRTRASYFL